MIAQTNIVNIKELTLILKIIGQCDDKHIMMLPIKTIASLMKVSTFIPNIAAMMELFYIYIYKKNVYHGGKFLLIN